METRIVKQVKMVRIYEPRHKGCDGEYVGEQTLYNDEYNDKEFREELAKHQKNLAKVKVFNPDFDHEISYEFWWKTVEIF